MIFTTLQIFFTIFIRSSLSDDCIESLTKVSGTHAPKGTICSGDLIFEDDFNSLQLDVWQHENTLYGGGHKEFQWYNNNRSNSYAEEGVLHIVPTFLADQFGEEFLYNGTLNVNGNSRYEKCTNLLGNGCEKTGGEDIINPIKSARIRTLYSFAFKYGKVEVRAKSPAGDWLWPAVWLMPKYYAYSSWPSSGEVDIMEGRGNRRYYNYTGEHIGNQQMTCTLHWGPNKDFNRWRYTHFIAENSTGFDADFHKYQFEWTPNNMSFFLDDKLLGTVKPPEGGFWEMGGFNSTNVDNPWKNGSKMAPFDQEFYIIINMAVGGVTFFSDSATNLPKEKPWRNNSTKPATEFWEGRDQWMPTWNLDSDDSHLKVDYVKVWAL